MGLDIYLVILFCFSFLFTVLCYFQALGVGKGVRIFACTRRRTNKFAEGFREQGD
jgi:hypothetical protein